MCRVISIAIAVCIFPALLHAQAKKNPAKPKLDPKWIEQVAALKTDEQITAVTAKMSEFNPGFRGPLTPTIAGEAVVAVKFICTYVTDFSPLGAFEKLKKVDCVGMTKMTDLSSFHGMKLTELHLNHVAAIADLTPLTGMPLEVIHLDYARVSALAPLQKMTTLRELVLDFGGNIVDLKPLAGLPLTRLSVTGSMNLRDLTPLKGLPLKHLNLTNTGVADISALRGMGLEVLYLSSRVADYSVIQGMPVRALTVNRASDVEMKKLFQEMPLQDLSIVDASGITDLAPLAGKKLSVLTLRNGSFKDLKPLEGMRFVYLDLSNCSKLVDIAALKGQSLAELNLVGTSLKDFTPLEKITSTRLFLAKCKNLKSLRFLEGATIGTLDLDETPIADLSPLASVKGLTKLRCAKTLVKDFSPLKNTTIADLDCDIKGPKDIAALKEVKTLKLLNGKPAADLLK